MNELSDTSKAPLGKGEDPAENLRKRKLWRNLFLLNLCVSLLLVGFFWLPVKLVQLEQFSDQPSVNLPQKGEMTKTAASQPVVPRLDNMLPPVQAVVNASSDEKWTYFDFSRGSQVEIQDPTSLEWDLAFRRGKVITNGGATNKFGKAGVIDLGEIDFNSIEQIPQENYVQDVSTRTETENPILLSWYKYNYLTHKLTAKKNVYATRTSEGKYVKMQFISFYCDNKEPGCIRLQYVFQDDGSPQFVKASGSLAGSSAQTVPSES